MQFQRQAKSGLDQSQNASCLMQCAVQIVRLRQRWGCSFQNFDPYTVLLSHPQPLFRLFTSHSNINANFQEINYPSGMLCWDSNPQPLGRQSPPINTKPGYPLLFLIHCPSSVHLLIVVFLSPEERMQSLESFKAIIAFSCFKSQK